MFSTRWSLAVCLAALLLSASCLPAAEEAPPPAAPAKPAATKAAKKSAKGAESPAAKPAAKSDDTSNKDAAIDDSDPAKALAALFKQAQDIQATLQKMQEEFQQADEERQKELDGQFRAMIGDLQKKIMPRMTKLAVPLYLEDAANKQAEQVTLSHIQQLFMENNYNQVAATGEKLLAAERKHPAILNFTAVAHFATHDFEKAGAVLKEAKAAKEAKTPGGDVYDQLAGRFEGPIEKYPALWEAEQKTRAQEAEKDDLPRVAIETTKGKFLVELFENEAPNTVANFISLVQGKKYDSTVFHRVIPGFMAQGGDPNTLDKDPRNDGQGGPGYHIVCECYTKKARNHFQGSLSMAHGKDRDTGGSQFYITHLPTPHLNRNAGNSSVHTVFGRVLDGLDVALALRQGDKIKSATVVRKRDHEYKPETIPVDSPPPLDPVTDEDEAEKDPPKAKPKKGKTGGTKPPPPPEE